MDTALQVSIVKFLKGNYIMIQGKQNVDVFFFLKDGKVELLHEEADPKEEEKERVILEEGDFFGVISCMSRHPREESAVALTNVVLIQVKRDQFGALIQHNAQIALRVIRSFSKRLRRLGAENVDGGDPTRLYDLAKFYDEQGQRNQSYYIYQRYLEYCPDGEYVKEVKYRMTEIMPEGEPKEEPSDNALIQKVKDNDVIFCEHEKGYKLFIVQKGQVKIVKLIDGKEKVLDVLKAGDIFGEMSILDHKPRIATAIALGEVELMVVTEANFQTMVMKQQQLAIKLITVLSERLWLTYRQLVSSAIQNPLGRLLDTLLLQVEKARIVIARNSSHQFNFGINELIGMSGLSPENGKVAVNKMLTNKKFHLYGEKNFIECLDLEELRKEVEVIQGMERREAGRKSKTI